MAKGDVPKVPSTMEMLQDLIKEKNAEAERAANAEREEVARLPSIEDLCVKLPLYSRLETRRRQYLECLRIGSIQFDAYCFWCERESTFRSRRSSGGGAGHPQNPEWMLSPGRFSVILQCQRVPEHLYAFEFYYNGKELIKYGQLPSLEDIAGADIRKYRLVLRGDYFAELKKATGLASHGVGIAAFVYLRRIFERLIQQHHDELISAGKGVEGFDGLRIEEKIQRLRDVLPPTLVRNRKTYSILSLGIHQLDEDACRRYFPAVRAAVIGILEQDLQARQRQKAEAAIELEIAKIAGDLAKRGGD